MKNIIAILFLTIISVILYGLTLKGSLGTPNNAKQIKTLNQPTQPFELSPERGRYILTVSLAEKKSFSLDKDLANAALPDVGESRGKYFVFFTPGVSLLSIPFYEIGAKYNAGQIAVFGSIAIFAILNLICIYIICKTILKLPIYASLIASLIFGFSSTSWNYAVTLYQHHITLFLILSSFIAVYLFRKNTFMGWIFSLYVWFAYGAGIWIDYPNIVLLLPNIMYLLASMVSTEKKEKSVEINIRLSAIFTVIAFVFLAGIHLYYNQINFGNYFKTSGGIPNVKVKTIPLNTKKNIVTFKEKQTDKNEIGFFKEDKIYNGLHVLFLEDDRGLLFFSPIFVIGLFGLIYLLKRKNIESITLISIVGVNVLLYASWGDPYGGWAFGPRYLIPSMAILSMGVAIWIIQPPFNFIRRLIAFLLCIPSSAIALLGVLTTNAVPPITEATALIMKYNFFLNLDYLMSNKSSSFLFNNYFSSSTLLINFYLYLLSSIIGCLFFFTLIVPLFRKK